MTSLDHEALDAIEGFDEREALAVLAGCAALDVLRIWGSAIVEALHGLGRVLGFPVR